MKSKWFAIGLILVGMVLLIDNLGILRVGWGVGLWMLLAILGGYLLVGGLTRPNGRGIFWGMLLLALAVYHVLSGLDLVCIPPYQQFPLVLLVIGAALILRFVRLPGSWAGLVSGVLLVLFGGGILLDEVGLLETWQVRTFVSTYWPVALMLFGAAFLIPQRRGGKPRAT